jgi:hypothetical protein
MKGTIVGLGLSGYSRSDVSRVVPQIGSTYSGWQGLVNGMAGGLLTAYAVVDGGQMICRLDQNHPAPIPLFSIDKAKGTVAIPLAQVRFDGM